MARLTVGITLLAFLAACGDGSNGPQEPAPDILGTYYGTWSFTFRYVATGAGQEILCPGSLIVTSQIPDGTFTGTWTQEATSSDCNEASGTLSGIVEPDGAITIVSLTSNGGGSGTTLEDYTEGNCVTTGFDDAYRGSGDGSTFEISYGISGDCGESGAVRWVTTFSGALATASQTATVSH